MNPDESMMPADVVIYHNPACSTSRNTLAMIRHAGIEPRVIEYLKAPPSRDELKRLSAAMGVPLRALLREKGTPFHELGLGDPSVGDEQLLDAMLAHPILINRPIVVTPLGTKLCRPQSEVVLEILPRPLPSPFVKEDGAAVVDPRAAVAKATDDAGAAGNHEGFERVAARLLELGHPHAPRWLQDSARTSAEAAQALNVQVGQIAKSVVFRRVGDDRAVLVVASGDKRVDERKVAALVDGRIARADAAFVKARTGFSIGGVSPVAHAEAPVLLLDRELFRFDEVWAAAGHPNGVFMATPQQLERLTGVAAVDVAQA